MHYALRYATEYRDRHVFEVKGSRLNEVSEGDARCLLRGGNELLGETCLEWQNLFWKLCETEVLYSELIIRF